MARIRFENGTVVNFNGNPTQADVEEVAKKLGIVKQNNQKQYVSEPEVGIGQSIAQGVASPFLKLYETGKDIVKGSYKIGQSLVAKAKGEDERAMQLLEESKKETETAGDYGYFGKVKGMTKLREGVGVGLEIGSYAIGAPGVKNIFAQGAKAIMPNILKLAGYGAKTGAVSGLGIGLQEEDATLGSVAKTTAGGAITGAIVAPALSAGITGVTKAAYATGLPQKIMTKTKAGQQFLSKVVNDARQRIVKAYEKSLPLTKTQLTKEANKLSKTGGNVFTTLAKYNIDVGNLEQAVDDLNNLSDIFSAPSSNAIKSDPTKYNATKLLDKIFNNIDERIESEVARESAKQTATKEIAALIKANKSNIIFDKNGNPLLGSELMSRLRKIGNGLTPFNASDPQKIGRSTGYSIADAVRDAVEEEGVFKSYRALNREWGQIINAKELLEDFLASGKKFKTIGGLSGTIARRILSAGYGFSRGGVGGAILSSLSADTASDILSNPKLKTFFDRLIIQNSEKKITPEIVSKLTAEIEDYVAKQAGTLRLPKPSTIYVNPKGTPNKAGFTTTPVVKTVPKK